MTFFQFLNSSLLTFAPLYVIYKSLEHSFSPLRMGFMAFVGYLGCQMIRMVFLATFAPPLDDGILFSFAQEVLKVVASLAEIIAIFFVFKLSRSGGLSGHSRILACTLGWVFAESFFQRLLPLWFASREFEFSWMSLHLALEGNISILYRRAFISAVCIASDYGKNIQVPAIPLSGLLLSLMVLPSIKLFLDHQLGINPWVGLVFHLVASFGLLALSRSFDAEHDAKKNK